jgi:hypothetical protein
MLRLFPRRWLLASTALFLVMPAYAQRPVALSADITFALRDADRSTTWPVSVRESQASDISVRQLWLRESEPGVAMRLSGALSRPLSQSMDTVYLYAFNPDSGGTTMKTLFRGSAGVWPNVTGNSNLVPVVANGEVFVGSNKELRIFGLKAK